MSNTRFMPLGLLLAAGVAAVVAVERRHLSTQPSAQTLLSAAADAQYEVTRVPASLDRMTDADEIALGNAMAAQAEASPGGGAAGSPRDAEMQAYLQRTGLRVTAHARRKLPWTFHYVADPGFVNAFALPGGHVFAGEGLLLQMRSEDALAAVLGHEVEHIDLRHCAERAQTEARLRHLGFLGDLAALPVELFAAGYSKDQELAADRDGTTLAVQAGYSYTGILQLFDEFARLEVKQDGGRPAGPLDEAARLSLATLSGYLASHPPSRLRSERIRELARERAWPDGPLTALQAGQPGHAH